MKEAPLAAQVGTVMWSAGSREGKCYYMGAWGCIDGAGSRITTWMLASHACALMHWMLISALKPGPKGRCAVAQFLRRWSGGHAFKDPGVLGWTEVLSGSAGVFASLGQQSCSVPWSIK
eukprot:scaffold73028_cov18-Tisochrysis_lutea.AAC.1